MWLKLLVDLTEESLATAKAVMCNTEQSNHQLLYSVMFPHGSTMEVHCVQYLPEKWSNVHLILQ